MATFDLVHDVQPWEVPIEGAGLPDNPVPFASAITENGGFGFGAPQNGHASVRLNPEITNPARNRAFSEKTMVLLTAWTSSHE